MPQAVLERIPLPSCMLARIAMPRYGKGRSRNLLAHDIEDDDNDAARSDKDDERDSNDDDDEHDDDDDVMLMAVTRAGTIMTIAMVMALMMATMQSQR